MNQEGELTNFVAIKLRQDSGMLSEGPAGVLENIESSVSVKWPKASAEERRRLQSAAACVDRLAGFLVVVKRITEHAQLLHSAMFPHTSDAPALIPGMSAAYQARDACTEFESLLFHGRATLDRLTIFLAAEYDQECDRYPKLAAILENFTHKDARAVATLEVLGTTSRLNGVLTDIGNSRSLRSLVTHRTSISEGTRNAFTAHRLKDGRVLLFDCEALGYPVLGTAHSLAREVPFVLLVSLACYLEVECPLNVADFEPLWSNPAVHFTDFVDVEGNGPRFFVCRMEPDGFTMETQHLRPEVLDLAQPPDAMEFRIKD